jgi:hypothetical protein
MDRHLTTTQSLSIARQVVDFIPTEQALYKNMSVWLEELDGPAVTALPRAIVEVKKERKIMLRKAR